MKEIGDILNMTAWTVAFHKYRIMQVLALRAAPTWYGMRFGTT